MMRLFWLLRAFRSRYRRGDTIWVDSDAPAIWSGDHWAGLGGDHWVWDGEWKILRPGVELSRRVQKRGLNMLGRR